MSSPILAPVIALVLWSFVMWAWLYATRMSAMFRLKIKDDPRRPRSEFDAAVPPEVRWVADNYNHLMEQPTIFYATALSLAFLGLGVGLNAWLAWGYVALRVIHSLVQATVNFPPVRWMVFTVSSLVLLIMTIRAAMAAF
ncbi:MAG: MAPEG family protein [Caulobacterales bacterium]|nr:MAPEG family protein [Caulobacterales bacterium]